MKYLLALFLSCFFLVSTAQQNGEETLSLDGIWKFKTDPDNAAESLRWYDAHYNDKGWDSMPVPGNWDLKNEYAHYTGKAWYRKSFKINTAWNGKTIRLLFEGVNADSKVWVNGTMVGANDIGYLPFEFDISHFLHYGDENTIVVMCDNTSRLGALWNWGGIRRPVKLVATGNIYISGQSITPAVDLVNKTATVSVMVKCRNTGSILKTVTGAVQLSAENGFKKQILFSITVPGRGEKEIELKTDISKKDLHLWGFDDPFLYRSQITLQDGNTILHRVNDRFGLRKIELDQDHYLLKLNGESIRPVGFNLVPDDRTTGSTLPLWRVKQDVDMLKSMGANMARLTHLPMHKEMLDYLDEKGILVFAEIPLWGYHQLVNKNIPVAKQWLQRLVTTNFNHPSIIGWCVGNEIGNSPGVMDYVEDAIRYVKSIDTSRFGVMVSHTSRRPEDPIQYSDIGLINNYGKGIGSNADQIHLLHPDKILFYTEFGYEQFSESLDGDIDARGMMDSLRFKPYLVGGSLWTFNDYRSNFMGTKEFSENRAWGIVDVYRQKKKAWYAFRNEYAPVRAISVVQKAIGDAATIIISPRKLFDLPAYILKDYTLLWTSFDKNNQIIDGGFSRLPVISPGDPDMVYDVAWKKNINLSCIKVELLSPLNYAVDDTILYFQKPAPPAIVSAQGIRTIKGNAAPNTGAIRIIIDRKDPAVLYKAKYLVHGQLKETKPTLTNCIDITNLSFGENYAVNVVAVNGAGESDPSPVQNVKVEPALAPPVIVYTEPADKGFYVGYTTDADDYVFRIQYTKKKGDYSDAKVIQSTTKGVMFVPGVENGIKYYFRMCRIKDNNFLTGWTNEHMIIPDGKQKPAIPNVQGIVRNGNEAIVVFEPVKKAIGYTIEYRVSGTLQWKPIHVNASEIHHYIISGLNNKEKYEYRMAGHNAYGSSGFSAVKIM